MEVDGPARYGVRRGGGVVTVEHERLVDPMQRPATCHVRLQGGAGSLHIYTQVLRERKTSPRAGSGRALHRVDVHCTCTARALHVHRTRTCACTVRACRKRLGLGLGLGSACL